jgi:hypothetical protein
VAILRDGRSPGEKEFSWDEGSASLEPFHKEAVVAEFQGKQLKGRFFLSRFAKTPGFSPQETL